MPTHKAYWHIWDRVDEIGDRHVQEEARVRQRRAIEVLEADVAVAGPDAVEWDGDLPDEVDCLEESARTEGGRAEARRAQRIGLRLRALLVRRRAEVVGGARRDRIVVEDHEAQHGELWEEHREREALVHQTRAAAR